jgi:lipid-A-disaccharide synthase
LSRVLICAGDPSGDLLGSQLSIALKKSDPSLFVTALGGANLEKHSDKFLTNIVKQHALGFAISPKQILYFRDVLNKIIQPELDNNRPDVVIPVDFYGFNWRVAARAKKAGARVFYYASPQFWASRSYRAEKLRPYVDLFLCLFPFELEFYRKRNIPAEFVSHPLFDSLPPVNPDPPMKVEPLVGLLPGSRPHEIARHLPLMVNACDRISTSVPGVRFVLFTVPHVPREMYNDLISRAKPSRALIELIEDENYLWRSQIDLAISASGMETLENALLGIPMVIMYKTNFITYWVARSLIQIPHIGMPNLLAGKKIVPEFVQGDATVDNISKPMIEWIKNPAERRRMRAELLALRDLFGPNGASDRAARVILEKMTA